MISIIAKNTVKADQIEAFKALARELVTETRREPGCIAYALNQDIRQATILTFIERWQDQAAIDAHLASAHFQRIAPQLGRLHSEPSEIHLYAEVE